MFRAIVQMLSCACALDVQNYFLYIYVSRDMIKLYPSLVIRLMLNHCEWFTVLLILNNVWRGVTKHIESSINQLHARILSFVYEI